MYVQNAGTKLANYLVKHSQYTTDVLSYIYDTIHIYSLPDTLEEP